MSIIGKISTIKAVSNLIVLRSKYDKVLYKAEYMLCKNKDLTLRNERLVIECKELRKEKNDNYERYLEESRFIYLWWLTGFATGVFVWAMIVKYLFV